MTDSQIKSLLLLRDRKPGSAARSKKEHPPDEDRETLGYARYSTMKQSDLTIEKQTEKIREHCAKKGWPPPLMFEDKGKSGWNDERAGWKLLLERVKPGTRVVIHETSRFARETYVFLGMMKAVRKRGGKLELVDGDSSNTMVLTIMAAVAEAEYRTGNAHMRDGKMQAIANGKPSRNVPMGYRKVGKDFEIDESQMKWIRKIFSMRLKRASTIEIVAYLTERKAPTPKGGKWTVNRVQQILTSPTYAGYLVTKRPVFEWEEN